MALVQPPQPPPKGGKALGQEAKDGVDDQP